MDSYDHTWTERIENRINEQFISFRGGKLKFFDRWNLPTVGGGNRSVTSSPNWTYEMSTKYDFFSHLYKFRYLFLGKMKQGKENFKSSNKTIGMDICFLHLKTLLMKKLHFNTSYHVHELEEMINSEIF